MSTVTIKNILTGSPLSEAQLEQDVLYVQALIETYAKESLQLLFGRYWNGAYIETIELSGDIEEMRQKYGSTIIAVSYRVPIPESDRIYACQFTPTIAHIKSTESPLEVRYELSAEDNAPHAHLLFVEKATLSHFKQVLPLLKILGKGYVGEVRPKGRPKSVLYDQAFRFIQSGKRNRREAHQWMQAQQRRAGEPEVSWESFRRTIQKRGRTK